MKKIGIMGGTFNPIHMGHINIALAAYRQYHLHKVLFIPSGKPPHKREQNIASDEDRYQMVSLAVMPYPYFEPSRIEIDRNGYSYTYETLEELKKSYGQDKLYFIIGADSLFYFENWRRPDSILKNAVLLAANRDTSDDTALKQHIRSIKERYGGEILIINTPKTNISSTAIRNNDYNHLLVPPKVLEYINERNLYGRTENRGE